MSRSTPSFRRPHFAARPTRGSPSRAEGVLMSARSVALFPVVQRRRPVPRSLPRRRRGSMAISTTVRPPPRRATSRRGRSTSPSATSADWPEARKRVRNARQFVIARIAGKDRRMPVRRRHLHRELARADLRRRTRPRRRRRVRQIFGALELPTDLVPVAPRAATDVKGKQPMPAAVAVRRRQAVFTLPPSPLLECGHRPRARPAPRATATPPDLQDLRQGTPS